MVKPYSNFSFSVMIIQTFPTVSNLLKELIKYTSHLKILGTRRVT
jgi:hypothetical protein